MRLLNSDNWGIEGALKKKACPKKSRPLLTYEKHQVQI
jgi:hypothetical protein